MPIVPSSVPLPLHPMRLLRLLLVEDNPTDALLARDALEHAVGVQFEVVQVPRLQAALRCLQAALRCLQARTFDLVVLA
jgi:CheY-like chemotaxis protein